MLCCRVVKYKRRRLIVKPRLGTSSASKFVNRVVRLVRLLNPPSPNRSIDPGNKVYGVCPADAGVSRDIVHDLILGVLVGEFSGELIGESTGPEKNQNLASDSLRRHPSTEHMAIAMSIVRIHRRRTRWESLRGSRARCFRSEGRLGPLSRSWALWTKRLHHQWRVGFWGRGLGFQNVALVGAVVSSWAGVKRAILELRRALDGSELHTQLVSSRWLSWG